MAAKFYPTLHQHLATDYQRNLAVTAGAGTGKTEVLTRRIIKIMSQEKLFLDRLLVLTFTDKAAIEMKERIYASIEHELQKTGETHFQKLKDTFFNNYISTFHAFCAALLREYPIEAGIDPYFRVLDETEKVFFLRKSINRALREMAANRQHQDIHLLSGELSRAAIGSAIFEIIQKREDLGHWLESCSGLSRQDYLQRLQDYRSCILREMAYKLQQSRQLELCRQMLAELAVQIPHDTSVLSQKRDNLLLLLPQLAGELEAAARQNVDAEKITELKTQILKNTALSKPAKIWAGEAYEILRSIFVSLRYLLNAFTIEDFTVTESHEEYGLTLLQALARLASNCLDTYRQDKAAGNYLDFQDMQLEVLDLFNTQKHRHILDELRERFLFIMVDEFQDTNDIQWQIIRKIAADQTETVVNPKLFIVGDEKQAIYSFRGGDVRLFSRVRQELIKANREGGHHLLPFDLATGPKDYAAEYREKAGDDSLVRAGEIVFADNFRSAAAPINFFNIFFHDLLSREVYEEYDARPQKLVCSGNRSTGSVELLLVDSGSNDALPETSDAEEQLATPAAADLSQHFKEALLIANKIKEVFLGDGEKYRRVRECAAQGRPAVAILLNRRTMLKTYEEALRQHRIDFTVVRGRGFFQRQEIVDLGNLLRFLVNPADDLSLVAYLRSPAGHLSDQGIFMLYGLPGESGLFARLTAAKTNKAPAEQSFSERDYQAVINAAARLEKWLGLAGRLPLVEFVRLILEESGYYVSLGRGTRGEQAVSNVEKLLDNARAMSLEGSDLTDFSEWLNNRIDFIEDEGEADIDISLGGAVQIMTVHQSKGLEFPMVFVPDLAAVFNLGERETLHASHVPYAMTISVSGINRSERPEMGINAPNPDNDWESEPILIKRIIKKRLRDKLTAEKKRLFYVAATRAMDHLVLIGHTNLASKTISDRIKFSPLDQLTSWMDWLNRILGLSLQANNPHGEIIYNNEAGTLMRIPYRKFTADHTLPCTEDDYRTEFPLE
ncbi:MAG: UvrD-helicase domain-containing protein [Clostridium sp.]|nr:UvrD-helicase domain-containing protein [Clostridium sp.]